MQPCASKKPVVNFAEVVKVNFVYGTKTQKSNQEGTYFLTRWQYFHAIFLYEIITNYTEFNFSNSKIKTWSLTCVEGNRRSV